MKKKYRIVVEGKAYEVEVEEIATETTTTTTTRPVTPSRPIRTQISQQSTPTVSPSTDSTQQGGTVKAPIPGTVLRVKICRYQHGELLLHQDQRLKSCEVCRPHLHHLSI